MGRNIFSRLAEMLEEEERSNGSPILRLLSNEEPEESEKTEETDESEDEQAEESGPYAYDYMVGYIHMDYCKDEGLKEFKSRYECEKEAEQLVEEAYEKANSYFDPSKKGNLAEKAAENYQERLKKDYSMHIDKVRHYCEKRDLTELFSAFSSLLRDSGERLEKEFRKELEDNAYYYRMYDKSYFLNKVTVNEHDFRVFDDNVIIGALEAWLGDSFYYTFSGVNDACFELEKDLNEHVDSYVKSVSMIFQEYLKDIAELWSAMKKTQLKGDDGLEIPWNWQKLLGSET